VARVAIHQLLATDVALDELGALAIVTGWSSTVTERKLLEANR
jgi:hypothetical protein